MDLLGEIVEHNTDITNQENISFKLPTTSTHGLPKPTAKKPSRWRQRLQEKGISSISGALDINNTNDNTNDNNGKIYTSDSNTNLKQFKDKNDRKLDYSGLSEIEQIHQENIEILAHMSINERENAKQELIDNLDPKVLKMLMRRSAKKYGLPSENNDELPKDPMYEPIEGSIGTWVGGEHDLDKQSSQNTQQDDLESKKETSSLSTNSLKSALKSTPNTQNSTVDTDNNNDKDNKDKDKDSTTSSKKIRFSKEAKVIYLNQKEKVKKMSPSPSNSDADWEDFQEVDDKLNLKSNKIDDFKGPSIEDAIKLKQLNNEDIINPNSNSSGIHFPQPIQPYEELDINDPKFNDKLYEKYFPDLPKNPKQLEWMKSDFEKIPNEISYDSIESVRFDFNGDIITNENLKNYINENQGLFNHSQNPELPGYTLQELSHYLRSTYPGQVCIACRTLGRILYKLGNLQYQVHEVGDEENLNEIGKEGMFEIESWKLIINLKIIDLLQNYSSDKEKNLSVKNYAIDALWLWKQGNGDEKIKKFSKELENELNEQ